MSETILHIGFPRTGSTFLQHNVFPYLKGIRFFRGVNLRLNRPFNKLLYADETLFDPREVREEFAPLQNQPTLISNEMFVGNTQFNYLDRSIIAHRLHQVFPDATIILFIRNQLDLLRSIYCKHVEGKGEGRKAKNFFWFPDDTGSMPLKKVPVNQHVENDSPYLYFAPSRQCQHLDWFIFNPLITLYKNLFQNVYVCLFEDLLYRPNQLIGELEEALQRSLSQPMVRMFHSPPSFINKSLNRNQIFWYRQLNKVDQKGPGGLIQRLMWPLKMGVKYRLKRGPRFRLPRFIRDKMRSYYRPKNQQLQEEYPGLGLEHHKEAYFIK